MINDQIDWLGSMVKQFEVRVENGTTLFTNVKMDIVMPRVMHSTLFLRSIPVSRNKTRKLNMSINASKKKKRE